MGRGALGFSANSGDLSAGASVSKAPCGVGLGSARSYRRVWYVLILVGFLLTCYGGGFIARSSFVVEGQRYFCLFDDAMISMRYADNWVQGNGLVWNPGERIEGYTNFAWVAIMAACHLLELSPSHTCLLVQIIGIGILWCCLVAVLKLCQACRLLPVTACAAVVMTGTFYNLAFFTISGMETGLLTCLVTFALAASVKTLRQNRGHLAAMLWFAPAVLVRIDVVAILLFVFAFLWLFSKNGRRNLTLGLLITVSVLAAHFLWRHHYYGEWFPNTYYLKATGWPLLDRIAVGIRHSKWTAIQFGLPCVFAMMAFFYAKPRHFLLLGCFATGVAYQVYVGGDAWPLNRFVIPASLGLFVLAAQGGHNIMAMFMDNKTGVLGTVVRYAIVTLCVVSINATHWDQCLLLTRPYTTSGNHMNVRFVKAVDKIATQDATVALVWAGTFPYYSRRSCVDILGKCDSHIAKMAVLPGISRAGHNKFDFAYSLNTYEPDVIIHVLDITVPAAYKRYQPAIVEVDGMQIALCIRKESKKIRDARAVTWLEWEKCFHENERELR